MNAAGVVIRSNQGTRPDRRTKNRGARGLRQSREAWDDQVAWVGSEAGCFAIGVGALALALAGPASAQKLDKVTLRTNWLFYGSHAIFFLGIDRGYYADEGIDLVVKQGNGSSNAVRLVANKDSDFAYGSSATMMNLAAQGAPVISVAVIDAQGTEAVLVRPDADVKTIKDLEGKKIMTTAGAGVNTFFPVVMKNAGLDAEQDRARERRRGGAGQQLPAKSGPRSWAASTTSRPRSSPTAARSR